MYQGILVKGRVFAAVGFLLINDGSFGIFRRSAIRVLMVEGNRVLMVWSYLRSAFGYLHNDTRLCFFTPPAITFGYLLM